MGPKKNLVPKKILGHKYVVLEMNFGSKKMLGPNKDLDKTFGLKKNFGSEKYFGSEINHQNPALNSNIRVSHGISGRLACG